MKPLVAGTTKGLVPHVLFLCFVRVLRMARKLCSEYRGALYHVMNRGDRREAIFRNGCDRELFLATLAEGCRKNDWQVHAYRLTGNHFHLVVDTPRKTGREGNGPVCS